MKPSDNPFLRFGLDPRDDDAELTRAMRTKTASLSGEDRQALQDAWRKLTSDRSYRARATLLTPLPIARSLDVWEAARALLLPAPTPELPALQARIDDGLSLPPLSDEVLFADLPFLPEDS